MVGWITARMYASNTLRALQVYSRESISGHQRALHVSREACQLRRSVSELATLTRRDLATLSHDLNSYSTLIAAACSTASHQVMAAALLQCAADALLRHSAPLTLYYATVRR